MLIGVEVRSVVWIVLFLHLFWFQSLRVGVEVSDRQDHKFDAKVRAAINDAGGEVRQKSGVKRIYRRDGKRPGLAISRSLGDFDGKDVGLNPEPQIVGPMNFEVGDSIIIASDGLWDMMRPDEATVMTRRFHPVVPLMSTHMTIKQQFNVVRFLR